jgi:hypothetical protein
MKILASTSGDDARNPAEQIEDIVFRLNMLQVFKYLGVTVLSRNHIVL